VILAIKRDCHSRGELLGGMSTRIYDAVVHRGVRTPESFRRWLATHPSAPGSAQERG